jgi:hypothetical protein
MFEWALIKRVAAETGYTVSALRAKINRGELHEEVHWRKCRDGKILIHIKNFQAWLAE